jgi:type IV pilus assembly protein PilQ
VVTLVADQAMEYSTAYPNPRLFLLDLPGARLELAQKFFDVRSRQVEFVSLYRLGEDKDAVRIEFNLRQPVHFDVRPEGSRLVLVFSSLDPASPGTEASAQLAPPVKQASTRNSHSELVSWDAQDPAQFTIRTNVPPAFKYFELKNPSRLVIDVENTTFANTPQVFNVGQGLVGKVRFGYGDTKPGKIVRCVFDLSREATYTVAESENGLMITFEKEVEVARQVPSPDTPSSAPAPPVVSLLPVWDNADMETAAPAAGTEAAWLTASAEMPSEGTAPASPPALVMLEETAALEPVVLSLTSADRTAWMEGSQLPQALMPVLAESSVPEATLLPGSGERLVALEMPVPVAIEVPPPLVEKVPATSAPMMDLVQAAPPDVKVENRSIDFLHNIDLAELMAPPPALAAPQVQEPAPAAPLPAEPPAPTQLPEQEPPMVPTAPSRAPAIAPAGAAAMAKYSGEPISLDLKDADIKDFMRLIGNISGLNVVLDPDVKGALTIFLNDVPWDQALDVVLKNNSLGKQLEGNVLRIATHNALEQEEQQRKRLADARVLSADLMTETRVLSYARAADLSIILKKVLSPRGDIIVDPRTNSMIITDIVGKFPAIDALIRQLDRKIKQVEIEARVIAATRNFLRDIGVQWGAIVGNFQKNTMAGAVPGDPFARNPRPSVIMKPGQSGGADGAMPLIVNLGANAPTSGLSFFAGIADNFLLDGMITAAERRGNAKLLSKPKIITQDNIEGFVQQGVKIPVQTTINNTVSVQFFDFSLSLTVTPQITEEGTIALKVNIVNSTPDFSRTVNGVPTINTQETRTMVLVENGGTVVIGGVLIDNEQTNVRQVPGFGNIPLLGHLFKNKSVNKETQELVFFLSPKIL